MTLGDRSGLLGAEKHFPVFTGDTRKIMAVGNLKEGGCVADAASTPAARSDDCQLIMMASKFEYAAAYKLKSESAHGSDSESC